MGRRVFLCCPLYRLALFRVTNLGKAPRKPPLPKSLSDKSCSWLHGLCVAKVSGNTAVSVLVVIKARTVGVSVPVLTVALCVHFVQQEEKISPYTGHKQNKNRPRSNRKLL